MFNKKIPQNIIDSIKDKYIVNIYTKKGNKHHCKTEFVIQFADNSENDENNNKETKENALIITTRDDYMCDVKHFFLDSNKMDGLIDQKINSIEIEYEINPELYGFEKCKYSSRDLSNKDTKKRKDYDRHRDYIHDIAIGYDINYDEDPFYDFFEYNIIKINEVKIFTKNVHSGYYPVEEFEFKYI